MVKKYLLTYIIHDFQHEYIDIRLIHTSIVNPEANNILKKVLEIEKIGRVYWDNINDSLGIEDDFRYYKAQTLRKITDRKEDIIHQLFGTPIINLHK